MKCKFYWKRYCITDMTSCLYKKNCLAYRERTSYRNKVKKKIKKRGDKMKIRNNEIKIYYKLKQGICKLLDDDIKHILRKWEFEFIGSDCELKTGIRNLQFKFKVSKNKR